MSNRERVSVNGNTSNGRPVNHITGGNNEGVTVDEHGNLYRYGTPIGHIDHSAPSSGPISSSFGSSSIGGSNGLAAIVGIVFAIGVLLYGVSPIWMGVLRMAEEAYDFLNDDLSLKISDGPIFFLFLGIGIAWFISIWVARPAVVGFTSAIYLGLSYYSCMIPGKHATAIMPVSSPGFFAAVAGGVGGFALYKFSEWRAKRKPSFDYSHHIG